MEDVGGMEVVHALEDIIQDGLHVYFPQIDLTLQDLLQVRLAAVRHGVEHVEVLPVSRNQNIQHGNEFLVLEQSEKSDLSENLGVRERIVPSWHLPCR